MSIREASTGLKDGNRAISGSSALKIAFTLPKRAINRLIRTLPNPLTEERANQYSRGVFSFASAMLVCPVECGVMSLIY